MALHFHEHIFDTAAMTTSIFLLALYVLAFFRALKLIHLISLLLLAAVVLYELREIKRKTDQPVKLLHTLCQPAVICFVIIITAITLLTREQIYTWWDDINFWSSDAKQLFYMNGFPGKYGNVSPEFGDYPPVTSLFKWLFMQLSPVQYSEGLQFAGYYTLNALMSAFAAGILIKPATSIQNRSGAATIQNRTAATSIQNCTSTAAIRDCAAVILTFLIPGIVNGIIFYGTPADITMGIVYGALLHAIWDRRGHDSLFYYGRISLYTSILLLTKSVGIEWAAFAFVFALILRLPLRRLLAAAMLPAAAYGSWLVFCLVNRRVAKLTAAGIQMASQGVSLPENTLDKVRYFWLGLWTMPMHADHNITLDLPIGALIVLILVMPLILYACRLISKKECRTLAIFQLLTCAAAYGIILAAHISIFKTEDQYLDAFAMTNSIARYGAPFTLGGIFLLMSIALDRAGKTDCADQQQDRSDHIPSSSPQLRRRLVSAACALFILLTADYTGCYRALRGYHGTLEENQSISASMIDESGRDFLQAIAQQDQSGRNVPQTIVQQEEGEKTKESPYSLPSEAYWGRRILFLRDGSVNHRVHDTYISKEASPVPVVYDSIYPEYDTAQTIMDKIAASHAQYVYIEPVESSGDKDIHELLQPLALNQDQTQPEKVQYGVIYQVYRLQGEIAVTR